MELVAVFCIIVVLAIPVMSLVALILVQRCRSDIKRQQWELQNLAQRLTKAEARLQEASSSGDVESTPATDPLAPSTSKPKPITSPQSEAPDKPSPQAPPTEPTLAPPIPVETKAPMFSPSSAVNTTASTGKQPLSRFSGFEQALGLRWTVWVGGLVLFIGAGLFVKYAFEQSWLGPRPRIAMGLMAGLAVLFAGERFIRRDMRALGQGLVGVGLAILYAALYGAYGLYEIMPQTLAFGLMIMVTTGGMILAARHDALVVSFLATLGGFLTPILLSSGTDARDTLFAYILILDIGVLGMAFFKKWRALDVLAFLGTSAMFLGWYIAHGHESDALIPMMLWLGAFYLVFLLVPFVYHLRSATCITGERFFLAVSNAIGLFGWAANLLHGEHPHILGLITLAMGATYLILGIVTRRRIPADQRAVLGFAGLFLAFIIIAVPIHLDLHGVTIAWAIKAPLLLYLAYRYRYLPVRLGSLIPLMLAFGRVFTFHWPSHSAESTLFFNTNFVTCLGVFCAGFGYSLIHQLERKERAPLDDVLGTLVGLLTGLLTLLLCHIELWQWLGSHKLDHLSTWCSALVWMTGALCFALFGLKRRSVPSFLCGLLPVTTALVLLIMAYAIGPVPTNLFINGRFLAALSVSLLIMAYSAASHRCHNLGPAFRTQLTNQLLAVGIVSCALLFATETWQWLTVRHHDYIARCLLPFIASGAALTFLFAGIRRGSLNLRQGSIVALLLATALGIWGYAFRVESQTQFVLSLRFFTSLLPLITGLGYARLLQQGHSWRSASERTALLGLCIGIGIALFALLNLETYYQISDLVTDAERSRWIRHMSLSLVWGLYATALLLIGFRIRLSKLRLTALALFGATALKLVFIDLAQVEEVYRIISFLVLGLLMILASYLYHRAVKRWAGEPAESPSP